MFQVHVLKDLGVQVPRSALGNKKACIASFFIAGNYELRIGFCAFLDAANNAT